jgi:hypothetical protein
LKIKLVVSRWYILLPNSGTRVTRDVAEKFLQSVSSWGLFKIVAPSKQKLTSSSSQQPKCD